MSYVIYNKETTQTLLAPGRSVGCYIEFYETASAAKAGLTRLDNKGKLGLYKKDIQGSSITVDCLKADFAIAETQDFRSNIEKTVTRKNAMTGEEFEEPINTPFSSSPSSETYWCS